MEAHHPTQRVWRIYRHSWTLQTDNLNNLTNTLPSVLMNCLLNYFQLMFSYQFSYCIGYKAGWTCKQGSEDRSALQRKRNSRSEEYVLAFHQLSYHYQILMSIKSTHLQKIFQKLVLENHVCDRGEKYKK